ncbi:hypothetical protein BaRGS_00004482 [Batillaria attramentaria]|uniref:Phospholipase B1, membrane-associated n=1 Tax=Batillaria attramentaria TaxID=370345 RepID=A0ABD0LYH4_9CAEN
MGHNTSVVFFVLLCCFTVPLALTVAGEEGPQKEPSATATESKEEQVLRLWEEYGGKNIQDRKNAYQKEVQKEVSFRFRNETIRKLWEKYRPRKFHKSALKDDDVPPFHCASLPPSPEVPTSVHALRPADIKVVAAMGDSLTAGTGISADWILEELIENRGLSWSGGGQGTYEEQITVPNILKNYNPSVYGYALGNGDEFSKNSRFNVAPRLKGPLSCNLLVQHSVLLNSMIRTLSIVLYFVMDNSELVEQAWVLIDRMKKAPEVDFENDWKLVTILSGNNDLCDYCKDPVNRDGTEQGLVVLRPPLLHLRMCCLPWQRGEREGAEEIAMSGRYDTRDDFTVVCQPFFNQTYVPYDDDGQPDLSFFAPDCFHLSEKGQAAAASALWNNMIESQPVKRTEWTPGELIECPTEEKPYIYTYKNGDLQAAPQTDAEGGAGTELLVVGAVTGVAVVAIVAAVVAAIRRRQRKLYIQI